MKYQIKTKRTREIHIPAEALAGLSKLPEILRSDVVAVFDGRSIAADEIITIKRGKLYLSSHRSGITEYRAMKKKYFHMYYGHEAELGELIRLELPYSKEVIEFLEKVR